MAILAGWNFIGKGGQTAVAPASFAPGVTATSALGSGLLAVNDLKNGLVGRNQTKKTLAEAIADNEYISFKMTPAAGKALTIKEVKMRPASQNRNRTFTMTANGIDITTFTTGTIFLPLKLIPVTGISGVAAPVEFRLYIYGHTDEWESVGIGERRNGETGLDLEVIGDIKDVVVPPIDNQAPSVPTGLTSSISSITANSFTVSWNPSTDNVGVVSYEVFTGTTSRGTVNHTTRTLTITGLTANTTYAVTVRARDAADNISAAQSTPLSVRTLVGPPQQDTQAPSVPTGLAASNITASSFTVSWNPSTDNVGVASYDVLVNGAVRSTVNHPTRTLNITGLTLANTTYAVTVRARDAAGNVSAASAALSVGLYPNSRSRMGINLSSVNEYTTDQPFKDLFKTARPWNDGNFPVSQLDANGWITSLSSGQQAIAYVMLSETPAEVYEMGQYVLLYEGSGTIAFEGAGVTRVSTAPGRIVYNVSPQPGNRWISITAVTVGNHIRNIRLLPAIYEADYQSNPWRPYHLSLWARFKTIRFMDWMATNHSKQITWEQRTTLSRYTYNDRSGVPLELIADLCNRLHTDAWICVPHQADDNYVAQMARLLRSTLAADLKVYVEYSNECWNYMFEQAPYCAERGRQTYPNIGDAYERHIRWYSRRCVQIYDIFEREFSGTSRLIRVLGGQQGNAWALQVMFEHENARNKVDAFAIAPYFGHEYACAKYQQVLSWTLPQFFNDIRTSALPTAWQGVQDCINYARSVNKPMFAYEGGQHFTGQFDCNGTNTFDNAALTQKFIAANLSPDMGGVYTMDLDRWRSMGGGMYCAFASLTEYTHWGCWGLLRYPKQNLVNAPKYQAILNWINNNPS
ncbi:MAG: Chitodextrinase [Candidatus Electronema aureum]|uniref:Chitodextrinase n=1 Tax=Candidatus Electronema aureum TaxID=2005002 RepID=A0A521G328_9BACT|nr:MAG: Chitodextrinase [Candidatus Electronema aureum]